METKIKTYGRDFKVNAVKLSYEVGWRKLSKLERELDLCPNTLSRWRKEYEKFGTGSFGGYGNVRMHPDEQRIIKLEKKIKEAELNYEILKKGGRYLYQEDLAIFSFIEENIGIYTVAAMCRALDIGEGRYQRWKKKKECISERQRRVKFLGEQISSVFYNSKQRYGCPRIAKELEREGIKISGSQVHLYMKKLGLKSIKTRKYKVTTDSTHNNFIVPNILNRQFIVDEPAKVWVSDITYIQTLKGFLYLTVIIDLFDRKVIGWNLSVGLSAKETTFPAWKMAVKNRQIAKELLFHSDRGVQYANRRFTRLLHSNKLVRRSMCRKGNHLDNAVAESFFRTLKIELIHRINILSRKDMKAVVFDFIENWYNKERLHSKLDYKTIEEFDNLHNVK